MRKRTNKTGHIAMMECYAAIQKNKEEPRELTQNDFQYILLSGKKAEHLS